MFSLKFCLCLVCYIKVNCQLLPFDNGTTGSEMDGLTLFQFGRAYNKPLLVAIGRAMLNLKPCSEWTEWSSCSTSMIGYFGVHKRSRKCGKVGGAKQALNTKMELDFGFCEGHCPSSYNLTKHGFCLKLYIYPKDNANAEAQCNKDEGHLINIDTEQKHEDVKGMLEGFSTYINIGGNRKDASSAWEYSYGLQGGFFKWYSSYPGSELCLALSNPRLFYDQSCSTQNPFICEIPYKL